MSEFPAILVPALATALLHFVWQGAIVGLAAWLALSLLRDARPRARYAVACLALLACVLLPAWTTLQAFAGVASIGPAPAAPALSATTPGLVQGFTGMDAHFDATLGGLPWIVALWAAGAATLSLRMACGWFWVRRFCRDARPDADGRWQACVDRLAPAIGIGRRVALRLAGTGDSPVTAGWWRPVVLLPVATAMQLPADLVEALLAHELAHVRRHDYLVNLLQGAAEALLFYHPVTWWLSHRIRVERELVADDIAAEAIGDRRRLALALSELERHLGARPSIPVPHYAPAAHGGNLMSRIQQLLQPRRRVRGGSALLPLAGLVLAGAAMYAHAHLAPPPAVAATATTSAAPAATTRPLPAPTATPGVQALPAPAPAPVPAPASQSRRHVLVPADASRDDDAYAIVRDGHRGYTMSGDMGDTDAIEAAQRALDGDFLWFRRDGKAWVVRDPGTIARARAAWAATDAMADELRSHEDRLKPHAERLAALASRMEAIHVRDPMDSPEMRATLRQMESLGERMAPLAGQRVALAARAIGAGDDEEAALGRALEALEHQQEALAGEMERHAAAVEAASRQLELQHAPMEAIAREMELASGPMEAAGKEMEAIGHRFGEQARRADAQVRALIDEAYRSGRAEPAPSRR